MKLLSEETKSYIEKGLSEYDKELLNRLIKNVLNSNKKILTWRECIEYLNCDSADSKLSSFEDLNIYKKVKSSSIIKLKFDIDKIKDISRIL